MSESLLWLAGGLVLLVAEVLVPGVFLFWLGLAALGTGVVVQLFDPPLAAKVATFAVLAAIAITAAMRLRRLDSRQARSINTAESGLVGRPAQALAFAGRLGRVRLGDSDWSARLAEDTPPPEPGAPLEVVGVDGTVLIVRPAPAPAGLANP
jgi:membrane protein implicated in regulation of membrane protease activity